jgi:predicted transcriptional regulator of viral defense system
MNLAFLRELTQTGRRIFTMDEALFIAQKIGLKRSYVPQLLHHLRKSKVLRPLTRAHYALADDLLSGSPLTAYEIAMHFAPQGALAYWSAMSAHDLSDQNLTTTFVGRPLGKDQASGRTTSLIFENQIFRLIPLKEEDLWGIELRFFNEIPFRVTDLERTLLDGLRHPDYCGGVREVLFAFDQALSRIDANKLQAYAGRCPLATQKRLGWVLEKCAAFPPIQEHLSGHLSKTYDKLDPQGERRGAYNARWKLIENI